MTIIRSRAPLRLGLAGGGSDVSPYCDIYGGAVLNATIDLSAYCSLAEVENGDVTFIAADRGAVFREAAVPRFPYDGVLDLHKGVYNRVVRDFNDGRPLPVKVTTFSDAPPGSGLGSSSTMVVAILTAFAEYLRLPLGEYDIARISFEVERQDIGLRGGAQDQYAATFGGVNFLEFYEENRVIVNPLRVKTWILNELEMSTVLYFTGVSRESDRIISEQIKNYRAKDEGTLEAVHRLKIDASRMKEALLRGEIRQVADILGRSWESKRQLAHNIGNEVIAAALARAIAAGAHAGKVSGAGGGGFMMLMVDPASRVPLIQALGELPGQVVNFHFVSEGAHAWRAPTT